MAEEIESSLMKRIGAAEKRTRFPGWQKNSNCYRMPGNESAVDAKEWRRALVEEEQDIWVIKSILYEQVANCHEQKQWVLPNPA